MILWGWVFLVSKVPLCGARPYPDILYCWILEILYCDPKGRRALPRTQGQILTLLMVKQFDHQY